MTISITYRFIRLLINEVAIARRAERMRARRLEMLSQCVLVDKRSAIAVRADGHGCRDLWRTLQRASGCYVLGVKEAMRLARVKISAYNVRIDVRMPQQGSKEL